ncbi:MAG: hypothetical protein M3121_01395 [Chloroflexota bacterium]|nr:hypothetical protein [Chloroflexota bacterium]
MIVFPILSAVISALCALVIAGDARRRPRPDKLAWAFAFTMFALAAGADAAGRSLGWEPWLARLYYATGPALVVGFLALGELYLLFPVAMRRFAPGIALLLSALWVSLVLGAPIDAARLSDEGWEAIERGPALVTLGITINSLGTAVIIGGLGYSIWRFQRRGGFRNRMIGCALIALGTLVVAAGGSLTRLGHYEYLYIAMAAGVTLIFAGVLWTRRPDVGTVAIPMEEAAQPAGTAHTGASAVTPATNGHANGHQELVGVPTTDRADDEEPRPAPNEAIQFIEDVLLPLGDGAIVARCAEWSVPADDRPTLSREEARQAWRLRCRLAPAARRRFDAHGVAARRQLAVLWAEVLTSTDEPATGPWEAEPAEMDPDDTRAEIASGARTEE